MGSKVVLPQKRYIEEETGKVVYAYQIADEYYGVKPFWKMYKEDFLGVFKKVDGKQKDILIFILEHLKANENTFEYTYKEISKRMEISEPTIAKAMKCLQDDGFIVLKSQGVWRINPNYLMKGSEQKRIILEKEFCKISESRAIMKSENEPGGDSNEGDIGRS